MNNSSSKKTWLIIIGIIVAAVLAYYAFFSNKVPVSDTLEVLQTQAVGADVLSLLNQVEGLKIDSLFFENKAYQSLQDYTVAIPPQGVGRPNPFAPIPGVNLPARK